MLWDIFDWIQPEVDGPIVIGLTRFCGGNDSSPLDFAVNATRGVLSICVRNDGSASTQLTLRKAIQSSLDQLNLEHLQRRRELAPFIIFINKRETACVAVS